VSAATRMTRAARARDRWPARARPAVDRAPGRDLRLAARRARPAVGGPPGETCGWWSARGARGWRPARARPAIGGPLGETRDWRRGRDPRLAARARPREGQAGRAMATVAPAPCQPVSTTSRVSSPGATVCTRPGPAVNASHADHAPAARVARCGAAGAVSCGAGARHNPGDRPAKPALPTAARPRSNELHERITEAPSTRSRRSIITRAEIRSGESPAGSSACPGAFRNGDIWQSSAIGGPQVRRYRPRGPAVTGPSRDGSEP
jgi:hypothetical protein